MADSERDTTVARVVGSNRRLDLNQRPLGYEHTPGPNGNRLLPMKAAETRASPGPPLGSDRRLLEGVPAQFPHNQGSRISLNAFATPPPAFEASRLNFVAANVVHCHIYSAIMVVPVINSIRL